MGDEATGHRPDIEEDRVQRTRQRITFSNVISER